MLISIIMPVYKTAPFIAEAIQSVRQQTYSHWQLVIVNDGSPDLAPTIAESYAVKDERITVIHQTNQGVSVARNTGISHCHGEYIAFLDSDDYYLPNFLQAMTDKIKATNCDSIYCGYIDEKNNSVAFGPPYAEGNILECYALHKQHIWLNSFIVKRSLLQDHHLQFTPNRRICQDQEFILKCGVYLTTVAVTEPLAFYRHNENSATNTLKGKKIKHDLEARQAVQVFVQQHYQSPYKQQILDYLELMHNTNIYNYQRQLWKAIVKDKKYDEVIQDLKDFGILHNYEKKHKIKNLIHIAIINSKNKTLWNLVSLFSKNNK